MEEQPEPKKTFDEILMESVDETLSAVGDSDKHLIYFYLRKDLGISKDQIPHRIDDFVETLRSIFGVGAKHFELLLVKQIEAKTGISYPLIHQEGTLQDCAAFARLEYENSYR